MNEKSAGPANGRHNQVGTCEASRASFVRQSRLQGDSGGQRKQGSEASAISPNGSYAQVVPQPTAINQPETPGAPRNPSHTDRGAQSS